MVDRASFSGTSSAWLPWAFLGGPGEPCSELGPALSSLPGSTLSESVGRLLLNLTVFLRIAGPGALKEEGRKSAPLPLVDVGLLLLSATGRHYTVHLFTVNIIAYCMCKL